MNMEKANKKAKFFKNFITIYCQAIKTDTFCAKKALDMAIVEESNLLSEFHL